MNRELVICFVLIAMLAIGLLFATAELFAKLQEAKVTPCEAPQGVEQGWRPPPLQLCPKDMELWDCIRDASYRSDI